MMLLLESLIVVLAQVLLLKKKEKEKLEQLYVTRYVTTKLQKKELSKHHMKVTRQKELINTV